MHARKEKEAIARFLRWQLIVALSLSVIVGIVWSYAAAISTLFGGLLVLISNLFFVVYVFVRTKKKSPASIARAYYAGELLKIILIAVLFVIMLHWYDVMLAPLLIGFCGTYGVYLVSAFL